LGLQWEDGPSGLFVQRSTDGGVTWELPVTVVDSMEAYFEDKQWINIDKTIGPTNGNIYIPWARFDADFSGNQIVMASSRDNGLSYSPPVAVSEGHSVQWPTVDVGMDGEVFVAWYSGFPHGIYFDVSYDEGVTFDTDQLVAQIDMYSNEINGGILIFPYPALATDVNLTSPHLGNLYMVYTDRASNDTDILFLKTNNGGQTWTDPVKINDDDYANGADQFHPWVSVDDQGVIHVIFYDRRLDANNFLFDLFYTFSTDGGETWSVNERITDVSSSPGNAEAGLIGEYIGLSAWQGQVQMVWTDTRNGNQDVYSGRKTLTGIEDENEPLPLNLRLASPYPNPFNSGVNIRFYSGEQTQVKLEIYDLLGRKTAVLFDGNANIGSNEFRWNGLDISGNETSSGIFFARLTDGKRVSSKKIVLLR
jgi:hypothetical protein